MTARFTQEDVYRGDGLNLYVYVVNNPLLWFDASGHAKQCSTTSNTNNNTTSLQNYYQDSNGRWHRATGEFATNVEVDQHLLLEFLMERMEIRFLTLKQIMVMF